MKKMFTIAGLTLALSACGSIQSYTSLEEPLEKTLVASVGENVFLVRKSSDLPNAFGRADIRGGRVDQGYQQLVYQGFSQDNKAVFIFRNVMASSNETTMSRSGVSYQTTNANVYGKTVNATSTTYQSGAGRTQYLSPMDTIFSVDPHQKNKLDFSDVKVNIIQATPTTLKYTLVK